MYKKVKRGNLLSINDRLYYVYGLCHNTLLTYQVFGNSKKAHYKLIIAGGMYYTDFTLKELVKGSNYRIKRCASDSEIEDIKNIYEAFKNRKKERIKKKSEVKLKNIKERCVILDERSNKKYLVIKRCGNTITCVSYPSLDILKEFRLDKVKNISLHERLENIEYGNMVIMIKNKYGEIFD